MSIANVSLWRDLVTDVASKDGLDVDLVLAVIWQESSGNPRAFRYEPAFWRHYLQGKPEWTRGYTGDALRAWSVRCSASYGLMQVLYPVACERHVIHLDDPPEILFQPGLAIAAGCTVLAYHLAGVGGDVHRALLSYNGGGNKFYDAQVLEKKALLQGG